MFPQNNKKTTQSFTKEQLQPVRKYKNSGKCGWIREAHFLDIWQ